MHSIQVWAHRGASAFAPENTLEAFALAAEMGADGIELDVHLARDGEAVVIHDETVNRTSDGAGRVAEMTLAQLKRLNFNRLKPRYTAAARIPTLREALALAAAARMRVNIELKNDVQLYPGLEALCLALVRETGMDGRVWISSFNHESLRIVKALDASMPCGALYSAAPAEPVAAYAASLGVDAVHPAYTLLLRDKPQVAACHAAGLRVHSWTPNFPASLRAVARLAPDALITDYPDRALRALGRG